MDAETKKQKGILDYIFWFAGEYKGAYIKSLVFAVFGVAFSLAPYALMGDMVKKLLSGEQNFNIYLIEGFIMAIMSQEPRKLPMRPSRMFRPKNSKSREIGRASCRERV